MIFEYEVERNGVKKITLEANRLGETKFLTLLMRSIQKPSFIRDTTRMMEAQAEEETTNLREKEFSEFWNNYPARNGRKLGKAETKRWFIRNITSTWKFEKLLMAVENYKRYLAKSRLSAKDPSRWLNSDWENEWVQENSEPVARELRPVF